MDVGKDEKAQTLDLRGLKCPLPVLKTTKTMGPLKSGAQLWLETTDPMAVIDIPAFCNENGHMLLDMQDHGDHHRFLVQKN